MQRNGKAYDRTDAEERKRSSVRRAIDFIQPGFLRLSGKALQIGALRMLLLIDDGPFSWDTIGAGFEKAMTAGVFFPVDHIVILRVHRVSENPVIPGIDRLQTFGRSKPCSRAVTVALLEIDPVAQEADPHPKAATSKYAHQASACDIHLLRLL